MIHAALLIAATTVGAVAAPPRPPDAAYSYALQVAGTTLGTSTVVIDGRSTPGTVLVKENASMTVPVAYTAVTTTRYAAATLRETGYSGDFKLATGMQHTDVTVTPTAMTLAISDRTATIDIPADPSAPLELSGDNLVGGDVMIPAILHATGAKSFTLAVLLTGKPVVVKVVSDPLPGRPSFVPAKDVELALELAGIRFLYWYDPATYVVHDIVVPSQNAEYRLTSTAAPGAATSAATPSPAPTGLPTPAPHFTSQDVSFASADGTLLAGTLTVPDRGHAPFPAVVLVHGSGPMDRDETIGPNAVFLQLSNALSNAGYAVLRYDKRGVAKSGGRDTVPTRERFLDDVKAAYRFARARHEVDAKRVYLLGHSEGGELVPTVAAQEPGVAGIILMAPPALPLSDVLMQQVLALATPDERAATERRQLATYDAMRKSTGAKDAWTRTSLDVDPVVDIARVQSPILILQGEGDAQVLVKDLPRLANAARAANRDVTVQTFAHDNHLFETIVGSEPQTPLEALKQYMTVPARIDARVLDTLTAWMARHTHAEVAR